MNTTKQERIEQICVRCGRKKELTQDNRCSKCNAEIQEWNIISGVTS